MLKLLLYFFLISCVHAQSLDFKELLNYSLLNNIELKSKKLDVNFAYINKEQVDKLSYGNLNYSFTVLNTNHAAYVLNSKLSSKEMSNNDFLNINNPKARTNYENSLVYGLPLFTGFKIKNAKKIAKLQLKASEFKYNYNEKLFSLELLKAYEQTILTKANIKAIKEASNASKAYTNYAKEIYKEGLGTKIDYELALVNEYSIKSKLLKATNNLLLNYEYLKFLSNNYDIRDVKDSSSKQMFFKELKVLQNQSINKREDLKVLALNVKSLKSAALLKNSNAYPKINLNASYGHNSDELREFTSKKDFYILSLNLKYNLFNPEAKNEYEKSKINYLKIKLQEKYAKNAIKLQIKKDYLNLNTKIKLSFQAKQKRDLSNNILLKSQQLYKNKLISMSELLKQQAKNQEIKSKYLFSNYEVITAQATLLISSGQSLKEIIND